MSMRLCHFDHSDYNRRHHQSQNDAHSDSEEEDSHSVRKSGSRHTSRDSSHRTSRVAKEEKDKSRDRNRDRGNNRESEKEREREREKEIEKIIEQELQQERAKLREFEKKMGSKPSDLLTFIDEESLEKDIPEEAFKLEIPKDCDKESTLSTKEDRRQRVRTLRDIRDQSLLDPAKILDKVDNLPIYQYSYRGSSSKRTAMGPLPQDWYQAFPNDRDPQTLDLQDMTGVSLASIKALSQMVSTIWQTVLTLNSRIEALETQLARKK